MRKTLSGVVLALLAVGTVHAWGNGRQSPSLDHPIFGAHDYIAFKAYEWAGRPTFVKNNLNAYFIGTEAPDLGTKSPDAEGHHDTSPCHCILFDVKGGVSNDFLERRTQEEPDKAKTALAKRNRKLAAFYAGALAHYLGDLSQSCHIMGAESHFGKEDKDVHTKYENAVNNTVDFKTRSSSLLDSFMSPVTVRGTTAGAIAISVARFTEKGTSGRDPRFMHTHYRALIKQRKNSNPTNWDVAFRDQTGQSINVSVNGIAKVLTMLN